MANAPGATLSVASHSRPPRVARQRGVQVRGGRTRDALLGPPRPARRAGARRRPSCRRGGRARTATPRPRRRPAAARPRCRPRPASGPPTSPGRRATAPPPRPPSRPITTRASHRRPVRVEGDGRVLVGQRRRQRLHLGKRAGRERRGGPPGPGKRSWTPRGRGPPPTRIITAPALVFAGAGRYPFSMATAPFGFLRVGAACPPVSRRRTPSTTWSRRCASWSEAREQGVQVLVLPELGLTGYTCGDLFFSLTTLVGGAERALARADASRPPAHRMVDRGRAAGLRRRPALQLRGASCSRAACSAWCPRRTCPATRSTTRSAGSPPRARRARREVRLAGADRALRHATCSSRVEDEPRGDAGGRDLRGPVGAGAAQQPPRRGGRHRAPEPVRLERAGGQGRVPPRAGQGAVGRARWPAYVYANTGVHESTTDVVFGGQLLVAENGDAAGGGRALQARRRPGRHRRGHRAPGRRARAADVVRRRRARPAAALPARRRWRPSPRPRPHRLRAARGPASLRARGPRHARRALPGDLLHPDRRPGQAAGAHRHRSA